VIYVARIAGSQTVEAIEAADLAAALAAANAALAAAAISTLTAKATDAALTATEAAKTALTAANALLALLALQLAVLIEAAADETDVTGVPLPAEVGRGLGKTAAADADAALTLLALLSATAETTLAAAKTTLATAETTLAAADTTLATADTTLATALTGLATLTGLAAAESEAEEADLARERLRTDELVRRRGAGPNLIRIWWTNHDRPVDRHLNEARRDDGLRVFGCLTDIELAARLAPLVGQDAGREEVPPRPLSTDDQAAHKHDREGGEDRHRPPPGEHGQGTDGHRRPQSKIL
jgi:hypothetical protein